MKFINYFIIFSLGLNSAYAETNWDELIQSENKIKEDTIFFGPKRDLVAKIATLPNGKRRLKNIIRLNSNLKPKIVFYKKGSPQEICNDFVIYGDNFNSDLLLDVGKVGFDDLGFDFEGKKVYIADLENPPKIVETTLALEKKSAGLAVKDLGKMPSSFTNIWEFYQSYLLNKINSEDSQVIKISLSQLNGLACDLALGNLTIDIKRKISHEAGVPERRSWLKAPDFLKMYQDFWKQQALLENLSVTEDKKHQLNLIALGMVSRDKVSIEEFASSPKRVNNLFQAMFFKKDQTTVGQKIVAIPSEVFEHYLKTQDSVKPKVTSSSYLITVQNGLAEVDTNDL